jgi:hypothetical protein
MTGAHVAPGAARHVASQAELTAASVAETARGATHNVWVARAARLGYAVRGLLYFLVGALAVMVAAGAGGEVTSTRGAISAIGTFPFGRALLVVIAVGLAGYSLWGFVRAILDPLQRGDDLGGLAKRAGYLVSGLAYGALVLPTVRLAAGAAQSAGSSGGAGNAPLAGRLLALPAGPWLLGAAGVLWIAGAGIGQRVQACRASFRRDFESWEMSAEQLRWATIAGRAGYAARGVVFSILGYFLVLAAVHADASAAKGLDGALQALAAQPQGTALLGLVAAGLACFGFFSQCCALWERVPLHQPPART